MEQGEKKERKNNTGIGGIRGNIEKRWKNRKGDSGESKRKASI
jgi:hypothetical protein